LARGNQLERLVWKRESRGYFLVNPARRSGYGGAINAANAARTTLNNSQKPVDAYLGIPAGGGGATGSSVQPAPGPSTPVATGTAQPQVNGQVIGLCSSGQLCLSEIRRAMGLR
jgi:hypothetical protein